MNEKNSMNRQDLIAKRVKQYYWHEDINCATTMLNILAEVFGIELQSQVLSAATGMHGAGGYGAQCGLVEGTIMFIGIFGKVNGVAKEIIIATCYEFAQRVEKCSTSLLCRELRPQGFKDDNPPHLCEELTNRIVIFSVDFIQEQFKLAGGF